MSPYLSWLLSFLPAGTGLLLWAVQAGGGSQGGKDMEKHQGGEKEIWGQCEGLPGTSRCLRRKQLNFHEMVWVRGDLKDHLPPNLMELISL